MTGCVGRTGPGHALDLALDLALAPDLAPEGYYYL